MTKHRNRLITLLLIILITDSACNYKLLVNKKQVININTGYLMFYNNQKIFFPVKHIEENNFFRSENSLRGYVVSFDKEEQLLHDIGEKICY